MSLHSPISAAFTCKRVQPPNVHDCELIESRTVCNWVGLLLWHLLVMKEDNFFSRGLFNVSLVVFQFCSLKFLNQGWCKYCLLTGCVLANCNILGVQDRRLINTISLSHRSNTVSIRPKLAITLSLMSQACSYTWPNEYWAPFVTLCKNM